MSVNSFAFLAFIFILFLEENFLSASKSSKSSKPKTRPQAPGCPIRLLKALRLNGPDKNEEIQKSSICNISKRRHCCSALDEIKILKSLNSYSNPKLEKFSEDMSQIYNDFSSIEPYLRRLNISNIDFHFDNIAWRKTNESQCFSGKFFLEQSNYDLIKAQSNMTTTILRDFIRLVSRNITHGNRSSVIQPRQARMLLRRLFRTNRNLEIDLVDSIGSFAIEQWSNGFAEQFGALLARTQAPNITITVPVLQPPISRLEALERRLNFTSAVQRTARHVSEAYFLNTLQSRASDIHVITLINYINSTLRATLQRNWRLVARRINITEILSDIMDEMFFDPALKRYFAWFFNPTSRSRYVRVYKYLESRFYKIFSDVISRTASLSEHAHYAVLKEIMTSIADSSLRSILWSSYRQIAGAISTHLALTNYTRLVFSPTPSQTNATFFRLMVGQIYSNRFLWNPVDLTSNVFVRGQASNNFFNNLERLIRNAQVVNRVTFNVNLANGRRMNLLDVGNAFNNINLRAARFAEFTGDNKRVCARVFRHNLVREAIFNEDKFRYCLRVNEGYQNTSAAAALGPLTTIKGEIIKILDLKRGFYCAVCNSQQARSINFAANTLTLSHRFCFIFVQTFRRYLTWRYTVFQHYQNTIFQYTSCFGRNANLTDTFPYESFDNIVPANFTEWEDCESVTTMTNVRRCIPVCQKIKLTTFSEWIEGDRVTLGRLYNYAITVMRQYGIQYGEFDPYRDANGTVTGQKPTPRILQEKKRNVVYSLHPDPYWMPRRLAGAAPGSPETKNSNSNKNSTNSTKNDKKNSTIKEPANDVDPLTALFYELITTIETTKKFTRKEHYNHDEITSAKANYVPVPVNHDIRNMTVIVSRAGLNPFRLIANTKFGLNMIDILVRGKEKIILESLDRQVIKDCVVVHPGDVKVFNTDYSVIFKSNYVQPEGKAIVPDNNQLLFKRYNENMPYFWKYPIKTLIEEHSMKRAHRKLNGDGEKEETFLASVKSKSKSFLSKFLFKIWFN